MSTPRIRYLIVNDRRRGSCKLPSGLYQGRTGPDPTHAHYTLEIPDVDTWRHVAQRLAQKYPDRHCWADCQVLEADPSPQPRPKRTAKPEALQFFFVEAAEEPDRYQADWRHYMGEELHPCAEHLKAAPFFAPHEQHGSLLITTCRECDALGRRTEKHFQATGAGDAWHRFYKTISQTGEGVAEAPHVMPAASHTAAPEPTQYPTERPAPRPASEPAVKPAAPAAEQKAKPATSAPAADVAADKPDPRPKKDPQAELIAALESRVADGSKRMADLAAELAVESADIQAAVAASATLAISARAGWVSLKK